ASPETVGRHCPWAWTDRSIGPPGTPGAPRPRGYRGRAHHSERPQGERGCRPGPAPARPRERSIAVSGSSPASSQAPPGSGWVRTGLAALAAGEAAQGLDRRLAGPHGCGAELGPLDRRAADRHVQVDVADHHLLEGLLTPAHQLGRVGVIRVARRVVEVSQAV